MNSQLELLQRRFERERAARQEAERILEQKALELYDVNQELRRLNEGLGKEVAERTSALSIEQIRLRLLVTNLDSGVMLEDENRKIVLVNQHFCELFDLPVPPEALLGHTVLPSGEEFLHLFPDPESTMARINELLERREICSGEEMQITGDRVYSRTFIPIFFGEKYLGHLWKFLDITASRRADETLRHSEEKYRGLIENMELGLLEVDNHDVVVRAYPRFCEMVGYTEQELIGQVASDVLIVPEFLQVLEKQNLERATGKAAVYEVQVFNKGRERIWMLISGAPILGPEDRVIGSLGIHYDITSQKNLQRDLEEARRNAENAQEAEKQFLANMSHEIRTPLNAIVGMSHLLYDTQPNPEQLEYLDILRNSAEMLRILISDILDLSKIRAGHLEVQQKEFDLAGQVRSLVKSAQLRLDDRPIHIEATIDPAIKNLVLGDDLLLYQTLSNLLGNAEKFTEKGNIEITVQVIGEDKTNNRKMFEIRVSDTGIGIPAEKLEVVFHSFRQVDGDIKRKFGGTGLGLAITRQIVELQGGTISVESEFGKGSTFTVHLPYLDTGKSASTRDKPELISPIFDSKDKCVLVVEDNHMNRKYIGALLKKWGVAYSFAHNGREGVELARRQMFNLILMDIQMPELDGYEATIAIRQSANLNNETPIVALTASALVSQRDKAYLAGMNDYLSKPFTPGQLFEKIVDYCGAPMAKELEKEKTATEGIYRFHPRLDAQTLAALYGNDLDYAREMFDTFLNDTLPEFESLRTLQDAGNLADLARLAHKLKPTLHMVGLPDLEQLIEQLEAGAKSGKPDAKHLETLLRQFETALPDAVVAVAFDFKKLRI